MILRIAVVGNAGSGKTTLSRSLARLHQLPLTHIDAIQFMPSMKIRPYAESIKVLSEIQNQATWLIDGFGPLDIIEKRFQLADQIVFIDLPLWRNFWWCTKRQIQNLWTRRQELPEGCSEQSFEHIVKLYNTLWKVHQQMRPELLKIFSREIYRGKIIHIRTLREWNHIFCKGILDKK